MKINLISIVCCSLILVIAACKQPKQVDKEKEIQNWVQLFNGENLDGWTIKIKGRPLGENYNNTFRVKDGVMQVNYDAYTEFSEAFGHIYFKNPYSDYKLRMEYRFLGEQLPDAPSWAYKNSGVMIHCQDPETIDLDQNFPVSIEVQLLGGNGQDERPTGNVCTPGTHIKMDGKLITDHCTRSTSKTFHSDEWVQLEIEVRSDSLVVHKINGLEVMRYSELQYGGNVDFDIEKWQAKAGDPVPSGFISLQSESHPIEFRNIELQEIK